MGPNNHKQIHPCNTDRFWMVRAWELQQEHPHCSEAYRKRLEAIGEEAARAEARRSKSDCINWKVRR